MDQGTGAMMTTVVAALDKLAIKTLIGQVERWKKSQEAHSNNTSKRSRDQ